MNANPKPKTTLRQGAAAPAGTTDRDASGRGATPASAPVLGQQPGLAERIHERIERRLGSRIHNLRVIVAGKLIRIEGRCATYYSKQLAQHAALGVVEDETLDNAIIVAIAR